VPHVPSCVEDPALREKPHAEADVDKLADDFAEFFQAELWAGAVQETSEARSWKKKQEELSGDQEDELDFLFEAQKMQVQQTETASESVHPVEAAGLPGGELTSDMAAFEKLSVVALLQRDGPEPSEKPFLQYAWRDGGLWLQVSESLGAPTAELLETAAGQAKFLHLSLGDEGPRGIHLRLPVPFRIEADCGVTLASLEVEEDERPAWQVRIGCADQAIAASVKEDLELLALQRAELTASIRARGWGIVDGFLRGVEADDVHLLVKDWWATGKLEPWKKKVVCDEYVYMDTRGVVAPAGTGWRGDVFIQGGPFPQGLQAVQDRLNHLMHELGISLPGLGGMLEVENPMLATFPGGGTRYARHFDSAGSKGRVVTAILYLNPFWQKSHGGELRMFPELEGGGDHAFVELGATPEGERTVTVDPLHGRLVVFLCDERNAHEVLSAYRPRMAITWWVKRMKVSPG